MSSVNFSDMATDAAYRLYQARLVKTDEVEHSGVKGQKWYSNRWWTHDKKLTPAGREHYGYGQGREGPIMPTGINRKTRAIAKVAKALRDEATTSVENDKKFDQLREESYKTFLSLPDEERAKYSTEWVKARVEYEKWEIEDDENKLDDERINSMTKMFQEIARERGAVARDIFDLYYSKDLSRPDVKAIHDFDRDVRIPQAKKMRELSKEFMQAYTNKMADASIYLNASLADYAVQKAKSNARKKNR